MAIKWSRDQCEEREGILVWYNGDGSEWSHHTYKDGKVSTEPLVQLAKIFVYNIGADPAAKTFDPMPIVTKTFGRNRIRIFVSR